MRYSRFADQENCLKDSKGGDEEGSGSSSEDKKQEQVPNARVSVFANVLTPLFELLRLALYCMNVQSQQRSGSQENLSPVNLNSPKSDLTPILKQRAGISDEGSSFERLGDAVKRKWKRVSQTGSKLCLYVYVHTYK